MLAQYIYNIKKRNESIRNRGSFLDRYKGEEYNRGTINTPTRTFRGEMESREERRNRFENTLVDRYRRRFE
jgi:hypothetical protein